MSETDNVCKNPNAYATESVQKSIGSPEGIMNGIVQPFIDIIMNILNYESNEKQKNTVYIYTEMTTCDQEIVKNISEFKQTESDQIKESIYNRSLSLSEPCQDCTKLKAATTIDDITSILDESVGHDIELIRSIDDNTNENFKLKIMCPRFLEKYNDIKLLVMEQREDKNGDLIDGHYFCVSIISTKVGNHLNVNIQCINSIITEFQENLENDLNKLIDALLTSDKKDFNYYKFFNTRNDDNRIHRKIYFKNVSDEFLVLSNGLSTKTYFDVLKCPQQSETNTSCFVYALVNLLASRNGIPVENLNDLLVSMKCWRIEELLSNFYKKIDEHAEEVTKNEKKYGNKNNLNDANSVIDRLVIKCNGPFLADLMKQLTIVPNDDETSKKQKNDERNEIEKYHNEHEFVNEIFFVNEARDVHFNMVKIVETCQIVEDEEDGHDRQATNPSTDIQPDNMRSKKNYYTKESIMDWVNRRPLNN